jgi:hypothetical protein
MRKSLRIVAVGFWNFVGVFVWRQTSDDRRWARIL